jgi:hypothetical protein
MFVNLSPPLNSILARDRGRTFTDWERRRTIGMIEQGYNSCSWTDARVDTSGSRESSVDALTALLSVRSKKAFRSRP